MNKDSPKHSSTSAYRRLLGYAFKYKFYFILGIVGFALFSAMDALLIMTVEFFFDALQKKTTETLNFLPQHITSSILFVPLTVISLAVIRGIGAYLGNFYLSRVGLNVVNDLRRVVFSHIIYLPQNYFDKNNTGELVSLIIYNIDQVTQSVTGAIKILFRDGLAVVFILGLLIYYNWKLTLVFFAIAPILVTLVYFASRYFLRTSRKIQKAIGAITHISTESFQGIKLVKSFRGENYEINRFNSAANDSLRYAIKFERIKAVQTPVLHTIIAAALALIMLLVLLFWQATPAAAIAYITAAGAIAKPFRSLTTVNAIIQRGIAAAETIFAATDTPQEKNQGSLKLRQAKGKIEFVNANFGYNKNEMVVKNFSLLIQPGETIAFVGESGSGKSTLANLLLRFYNLSSGKILIDDQPIEDIELTSLRSHIALVNQQAVLFNDTVFKNIAYGTDLKDKTIEDVKHASQQAYAKHFIDELELQFETKLGEAGDSLSGGQRQRITIARALLKDAPILILDEATSALDNESEKNVQYALDNLKKDRTTIIIAHRLSTIENADKIAVLDKGNLVEFGDHDTLIKKGGYYASLHSQSQLTEE